MDAVARRPGAGMDALGRTSSDPSARREATPNLDIVIEDGRNYLLRSEELFDVISLEPPRLQQAAVVNLYTREFYRLARDHLADGGILAHRLGTSRGNAARATRRRDLLELEARAESPAYWFDVAETDEQHRTALTAALEDARSRVHAERRREVRQLMIQTYRQR